MRRNMINEELTKAEVRNIVASELAEYLRNRDFERRIRELTSDVMEKFFKTMYNKRSVWKNELKNA